MIILTDAEYKRRIEEARQQGWKDRCEVSERDAFRESLWRAIRESRQDTDRQIEALTKTLVKAGVIEDPFEPPKCSGSCATAGTPGY